MSSLITCICLLYKNTVILIGSCIYLQIAEDPTPEGRWALIANFDLSEHDLGQLRDRFPTLAAHVLLYKNIYISARVLFPQSVWNEEGTIDKTDRLSITTLMTHDVRRAFKGQALRFLSTVKRILGHSESLWPYATPNDIEQLGIPALQDMSTSYLTMFGAWSTLVQSRMQNNSFATMLAYLHAGYPVFHPRVKPNTLLQSETLLPNKQSNLSSSEVAGDYRRFLRIVTEDDSPVRVAEGSVRTHLNRLSKDLFNPNSLNRVEYFEEFLKTWQELKSIDEASHTPEYLDPALNLSRFSQQLFKTVDLPKQLRKEAPEALSIHADSGAASLRDMLQKVYPEVVAIYKDQSLLALFDEKLRKKLGEVVSEAFILLVGPLVPSMSHMVMTVVDKLALELSQMPVQDGAPTLSQWLAHTYYLLTSHIAAEKETCQMLRDLHRQANEEYVPPPPPPPVESITEDADLIRRTQESIFKVCLSHFGLNLETLPADVNAWMSSQSRSSGSQCSSEQEDFPPPATYEPTVGAPADAQPAAAAPPEPSAEEQMDTLNSVCEELEQSFK